MVLEVFAYCLCTKRKQFLDFIFTIAGDKINSTKTKEVSKKMIEDMLKRENIRILDKADTWEEAIHVSLKPLVDGGYVKTSYIDNVIESTHKMGPYYVLTKDIAFIHGRPDSGVLKKQLAVTLLKEPILFSETTNPVRLLIALAATDSETHLDTMRVLATIFMDEERIDKIVRAKSEDEIYQLFIKAEQETEE